MKDKSINPASLPESETFVSKDPNQYKHLADTGKPIPPNEKPNSDLKGKTFNRSSKEEGLNEKNSVGSAGAFEGLENQENGRD
jgi:hypothetical protein